MCHNVFHSFTGFWDINAMRFTHSLVLHGNVKLVHWDVRHACLWWSVYLIVGEVVTVHDSVIMQSKADQGVPAVVVGRCILGYAG